MDRSLDVSGRARVRDLYRAGWAPDAIAELLGTTPGRVRNVLRDAGVVIERTHLLADYAPPDEDGECLTPRQREERRQSRRAALYLRTSIDMTEGLARRIMGMSDMDLEYELGMERGDVNVVREIAREWWERIWAAKTEAMPQKAGCDTGRLEKERNEA